MHENQRQVDKFLSLLRPVERELEAYCRRLIWNAPDVPDALQNAVVRAFAAFDRYHEDASFRAWMFKILTNEIFSLNRKYARIAEHEFHLEPEEMDALPALPQADSGHDWLADPEALRQTLDEELVAALKTLNETERAVLLLRAIGEFRYVEIAESVGIPLGSVMGNLSRARKKMRCAIRRFQPRTTK